MATHTPGPWRVVNGGRRVDGPFVTTFGEGSQPIADVRVPNGSKNERLANARLIAAAPDLYHALVELVEYETAKNGGKKPKWPNILAALAKSEGRDA